MANDRITISEWAEALALRSHCSRTKAETFLRKMFQQIVAGLDKDGFVKVKGLGTFKIVTMNRRESVDVNTGERIEISEHQRLMFTPDLSMKARVNKPFEKFDTIVLDEATEQIEGLIAEEPTAAATEAESVPEQPAADATPTAAASENADEALTTGYTSLYIGKPEPAPEPVVEETSAPLVDEETEEEEAPEQHGRKWWKVLLFTLLMLLLIAASYVLGYHRVVALPKCCHAACHATDTVDTLQKIAIATIPDTLIQSIDDKQESQTDTLQALVQQYEQVGDGDYLIVGTQEEHVMKAGDTLLKMARAAYGNHKLANYIVFYNKIANPDVIPLGTKVKIPRLVPKENEAKQ